MRHEIHSRQRINKHFWMINMSQRKYKCAWLTANWLTNFSREHYFDVWYQKWRPFEVVKSTIYQNCANFQLEFQTIYMICGKNVLTLHQTADQFIQLTFYIYFVSFHNKTPNCNWFWEKKTHQMRHAELSIHRNWWNLAVSWQCHIAWNSVQIFAFYCSIRTNRNFHCPLLKVILT